MKKIPSAFAAFALATGCQAPVETQSTEVVGTPAPGFTLAASDGRQVSFGDFQGKTVVLEWHNPECPFVRKHYESGNMQKTQQAAAGDGVTWLTINSGAPGKQGHLSGEEARTILAETGATPAAYLLDPDGRVGKAYDAKTTPHMYIVSEAGALLYAGGIDDRPTADQADIAGARNHVLAALAEIKAGKPVSVATSRPYGCNVKYADS